MGKGRASVEKNDFLSKLPIEETQVVGPSGDPEAWKEQRRCRNKWALLGAQPSLGRGQSTPLEGTGQGGRSLVSSQVVEMLKFPPRKHESHRYGRHCGGGWDQKSHEMFLYTSTHERGGQREEDTKT